MRSILPVATVLLLASFPGRADEATAYALDPVHTRVLVSIGHAGFSQALGIASGSEGALLFDPDDWQQARLDVRIPLARLDFGDPDWNRAVHARNLLDTGRFPEARFVSERVETIDPRRARVCGTLDLHGVAKPQCLEVTVNAVERHPMPPFRRTAGFSATAQLSRAAFGIDAWPSVIGDTVTLRIEAEAIRDADAADAFERVPVDGDGVTARDPEAYPDTEATDTEAVDTEAADLEAAAEAALRQIDAASDDSTDIPPTPEPMP